MNVGRAGLILVTALSERRNEYTSDNTMLTPDELRDILREECGKAGGVTQWADAKRLSRGYVYNVLSGTDPSGYRFPWLLGTEGRR